MARAMFRSSLRVMIVAVIFIFSNTPGPGYNPPAVIGA